MRTIRSRIQRSAARVAGLLLLATWLLPGTAWAQFETLARAALVIGNGAYAHDPLVPLDNPLNDAREMNRRLTELGFDVTLVEDGDAAGMEGIVERIPEVFPSGGVGVFFYAGHGVQYKGVNYLLPTDFELTTPEDLPRSSLALNTILQAVNDAGVKIGIIILDACRESPVGTVSDAVGQGLALLLQAGQPLLQGADTRLELRLVDRPFGVAVDQPAHAAA